MSIEAENMDMICSQVTICSQVPPLTTHFSHINKTCPSFFSPKTHSSQLRLIPYLHHTSSVLRYLPLELLSEIFNEGGSDDFKLANSNPWFISFLVSNNPLFRKSWQEPQPLGYLSSREIYTPCTGGDEMLLHINGKFTMRIFKSSVLSESFLLSQSSLHESMNHRLAVYVVFSISINQ